MYDKKFSFSRNKFRAGFARTEREWFAPMFFTGLFCGFRAVRLRRLHFLRGVCAAFGGAEAGSH
ncbi:MAG: hypothetical protein WCI89_00480 [bacterium]